MEQVIIKTEQTNGNYKATMLVKVRKHCRIAYTDRLKYEESSYLEPILNATETALALKGISYKSMAEMIIFKECIIKEMNFRGIYVKTDEERIAEAGY